MNEHLEEFAKPEQEKGVLSVPEMAKYLNIGLNVAYNLTHKPGFPAVRITKCRVVIPVKLLDKWLEENIGL